MANIEMHEYEAVTTDRDVEHHTYLAVGEAVPRANAAGTSRNNTVSERKSLRTACLQLIVGIALCAVSCTITGVVVYHVIIGARPATSSEQKAHYDMNQRVLDAIEKINSSIQTQYGTLNQRVLDSFQDTNRKVDSIEENINSSNTAVAFSVHSPNGTLTSKLSPLFKYTHVNTGSYNMSTGIFTCPTAGIYMFSLTLYVGSSSTSNVYCRYMVNGFIKAFVKSYHDAYDTTSSTMVVTLDVGDVVYLECHGWDGVFRNDGTSYSSGVLITPT